MDSHKAIEATLDAFYEIISGPNSQPRDWDKLRSLFFTGTCVFPNSITGNPVHSAGVGVDTYIDNLKHFLAKNDFYESGTTTRIDIFDGIASTIGSYEARHSLDDPEPYKRGVIFTHMACVGKSWKITGMVWQDYH